MAEGGARDGKVFGEKQGAILESVETWRVRRGGEGDPDVVFIIVEEACTKTGLREDVRMYEVVACKLRKYTEKHEVIRVQCCPSSCTLVLQHH